MRAIFFLFFFFQAEDGIRDGTVTGVQTCALPISLPEARRLTGPRRASRSKVLAPEERSEERRVGKSVDLGGRRIIKKKKKDKTTAIQFVNRAFNETPKLTFESD